MMTPIRSVALPTQAGHQVQFRNGVAVINDTRDLPYLLSRDDVKIEMSEYAMSWMSDVLSHVQVIKAQVHWPEGYDVIHHHADEFDIISPTPPQESSLAGLPTSDEDPVEVSPETDPLAEALKVPTRKAWRKPPSNSSAS